MAADPGAESAEGDRAPDAQAAVPDLERVERVLAGFEVQLGVGEDVVEAPADDAEHDRPAGHVPQVVVSTASGTPAPCRDHQRECDAGEDAQGVGADRQRPEMPHALRRRGQIRQRPVGHRDHRISTVYAPAMRAMMTATPAQARPAAANPASLPRKLEGPPPGPDPGTGGHRGVGRGLGGRSRGLAVRSADCSASSSPSRRSRRSTRRLREGRVWRIAVRSFSARSLNAASRRRPLACSQPCSCSVPCR